MAMPASRFSNDTASASRSLRHWWVPVADEP
jgi:hypothetical protein